MARSSVNTFRTCHVDVKSQYAPKGSSLWPW